MGFLGHPINTLYDQYMGVVESMNRRPLAKAGPFGITYLHSQNPVMVAWWSAVFPGFGHFLLNQYIRGTILTLTEVIINTLSHLNEAMVFSFCGQIQMAKAILDPQWIVGYIAIFLFSIADSYRSCLAQNKLCQLAELENAPLPGMYIGSSEALYIEQKNPLTAVLFSVFFPGLGQMYNHRYMLALYAFFWWWIYISLSHMHESLVYLILGNIPYSNSLLHPHWLLFIPSVLGGSAYHAYVTTVEHNRLFRLEQRQHLGRRYQQAQVRIFSTSREPLC
jgi:TM2 domain-containing membrane protein YozV